MWMLSHCQANTAEVPNHLHSLALTLYTKMPNIQIFQRWISLSSCNISPLSLTESLQHCPAKNERRNKLRLGIKSFFAYYTNLLCACLVHIKFIDSMSLCGLLVVLLGLSVCVVPSLCAVSIGIVSRLCLKSVYLILMNFLFLM